MSSGFGTRLAGAVADRGPLCVGIDPHPELLRAWGIGEGVAGLERFALAATDALAGTVAVLKPQSALFEAHGAAGLGVLERVIERARAAGALVLLDVKRGDIGSTMHAYASAYLGAGAALAADAITVSPYLGTGALEPAFETARASGAGVFVLARTSNPEASGPQLARLPDGRSVAQSIVDDIAERNAGATQAGDFGVVVGATTEPGELELAKLNGPILAPGMGAQGAGAEDLRRVFGAGNSRVLPVAARSVLEHGPDADALAAAASRTAESAREVLEA